MKIRDKRSGRAGVREEPGAQTGVTRSEQDIQTALLDAAEGNAEMLQLAMALLKSDPKRILENVRAAGAAATPLHGVDVQEDGRFEEDQGVTDQRSVGAVEILGEDDEGEEAEEEGLPPGFGPRVFQKIYAVEEGSKWQG